MTVSISLSVVFPIDDEHMHMFFSSHHIHLVDDCLWETNARANYILKCHHLAELHLPYNLYKYIILEHFHLYFIQIGEDTNFWLTTYSDALRYGQ